MRHMWETATGLCKSAIVCENCGADVPVEGFPITFTDNPLATKDPSTDTETDEPVEDHPAEIPAE